jgi:LacI family transcriptional regulator
MSATIKDIAREARVSIATVSRTLNEKDGVGSATRERIRTISRRLNYFPNLQTRSLLSQKPHAPGIVIPQAPEFAFSNPYYAETVKGIEKKTRESGQFLVFSFSEEESYARMVQHGLPSGVIVLANRMDTRGWTRSGRWASPWFLFLGIPVFPRFPAWM